MGGHESLLMAGRYPDRIKAVVSFNAVVDLAAWFPHNELASQYLREEIGGSPQEVPTLYEERNAMAYAETIARVPCLIHWDKADSTVLFQEEEQSGALHRRIREIHPEAPVTGVRHDNGHGWVDPDLALNWLLGNGK